MVGGLLRNACGCQPVGQVKVIGGMESVGCSAFLEGLGRVDGRWVTKGCMGLSSCKVGEGDRMDGVSRMQRVP